MKLYPALKAFLLCAVSILALFGGFFDNSWRIANHDWFEHFQRDSESCVIGRVVKSRQDGILSSGGLTGFGSLTSVPVEYADWPFNDQYRAYTEHLHFGAFTPYLSQNGGQGMLFSVLDRLINVSPEAKLTLFHVLESLCSAAMLSAVILWFHLEFGWTVSLSVLFAAVFSQWLVIFGRNLWWSLGVFYLPAIALMYFLRFRGGLPGVSLRKLGALALVIVFIKCFFNGCEYITTTLAMMAVPVIYHIILDSVRLRESLKALGTVALGSCLGILLSFCVLCFQVASVKGHFSDGVAHITYSFHKRTYGDPHNFPGLPGIEQEGLTATPGSVVAMYANGTFFDASCFLAAHGIDGGNSLQIKYWHLLLAFSVVSILLYSRRIWSTSQDGRRQEIALIWATWFSILAPLSWFVIFKAHSYVHKHMNYLVWQMPFVLFGFAMCGATFRSLGSDLIRLWRRPA